MTAIPTGLPADAIEVARVIDAWGVRGGVKLQPFSSTADGLLRVKTWYLVNPANEVKECSVDTAKWHADTVTATLMGITNREQVESWRGWRVWVSKSALPKADVAGGEFYWMDLLGCTAFAADQSVLGAVTEVSENGVHAVLHIDCGAGIESTLIPFVEQYVGVVDLSAKTIQTQWLREWLEPLPEPKPKVVRVKKDSTSQKTS